MRSRDELTQEANLRLGTVLHDKWRLDSLLGIGGSAAVYAATHKNKSRVAIKWMFRDWSTRESRVERFLREGYIANSVAHPAVVRVFDDGKEDGQPFLVMELLEGKTLDALQRERRERGDKLTFVELAPHLLTLLDVLAVAHDAGILHRDIKPTNLFLTDEGAFRVLDFGLAAPIDVEEGDGDLSIDEGPIGTAGTMAPEQASGRADLVDARSDLWSVGATAHLLLTGRHVHDAKTAQELNARVATRPVRPIRTTAPELSIELATWLDRALAFSRNERFASAKEMAAALRHVVEAAGPPALVREASPPEKPRSTSKLVVGLGLLLLSVVVLALASRNVRRTPTSGTAVDTPASAIPVTMQPALSASVPPAAPSAAPRAASTPSVSTPLPREVSAAGPSRPVRKTVASATAPATNNAPDGHFVAPHPTHDPLDRRQ